MQWQYTLPLLAASASLLAIAFYAWRRRGTPGAKALALLMLAGAEWGMAYALSLSATEPQAKYFWDDIKYLGIVVVPLAWLAFAIGYTGHGCWLTPRKLSLLAVEPLVTLLLIFTNETHGLFWISRNPVKIEPVSWGPWFWVNTSYSYLLILVGTLLLIRVFVSSTALYRGQRIALLIGALVPWVGNAASVAGLIPAAYPDPAPFAFVVTGVMFLWALFRRGFLDVVPVARSAVIESLRDGMIALNTEDRIVDLNPATQLLLGRSTSEVIGHHIAEIVPGWVTLLERHRDAEEGYEEITIRGRGSAPRSHELAFSLLRDRSGRRTGRLILIRDVTERKRAEAALRKSEERYRSVVENVKEVVFQTDAEGRWTFLNFAWEEITGFSVAETIGKDFLGYVHPEDRGRNLEEFLPLVERRKDYCRHEVRYLTREDETRWIEVYARLTLAPDGSVLGTSGTLRDLTERKQAEDALRESEERFRAIFDNTALGISIAGLDRRLLETNRAYQKMVGYSGEELFGKPIAELSLPEDVPKDRELSKELLSGKADRYQREKRYIRKDGGLVWVQLTISVVRDVAGRPEFLVGLVEDITERKQAEEELRRSEHELAEAQRIGNIGSWSFDIARNEARWSDEMYRIFGFAPQEFVVTYKRFLGLVHPDDRDLVQRAVREALQGGRDRRDLDYRLVRTDGEVRFLHSEYEAVSNGSGRPIRLVGTSQDITERKALEEKLEHQAFHDPTTGLPNRTLFMYCLEHALARVERRTGKVAVMFMDLDNFKYVNDTLGHQAGDELLVAVSDHLRRCLRPEDTAARLGGDEFAALLEDVENVEEAARVADRIIGELSTPFVLEGQEVYVTPSIGIVIGGRQLNSPKDLLRSADLAMYRAKEEGKACYRVFDPCMEEKIKERLTLENDLRRAIEREELEVHYQPVVAVDNGRIIGMEALVRWEHPERGLVLPDEFVPLAEEIGLIVPIGRLVLREACLQTREWQRRYPSTPPLIVGVNVSARQLSHPGLIEEVEGALQESGLDTRWLTLEITESAMVEDGERHIGTLRKLRDLGVRFALDDFGVGYSSLSYLKRLPVGMMKIDRSFLESTGENTEDEVLLSGVVGIAHGLGLRVLAEGVETTEQLERVRALGCDLAQGYYFSKPLYAEAAGELLSASNR